MNGRLRHWFFQMFDDHVWQAHAGPQDYLYFARYAQDFNCRYVQLLGLIQGGALLLWWPFNHLINPTHAPGEWQMGTLFAFLGILSLLVVWLIEKSAWAREHIFFVALGSLTVGLGFLAWVVARMQLVQGWPFGGQPMPFMAIPFLLSMPKRVFLSAVLAVGYPFIFAWVSPIPMRQSHTLLYIGLTISPFFLALAMGHRYFLLTRNRLLQEWRIKSTNDALDQLNRALVVQVNAKTRSLQSLAQQAEEVREGERSSLAQELHDELGQLLTGIRFELELAQMQTEPQQAELTSHLLGVEELLGQVTENVRDVLTMLRPKIVAQSGFLPAVRWLANTIQKRYGLEINSRFPKGSLQLNEEQGLALFRILQESLTNVVKHAQASQVSIEIKCVEGELLIEVQDDGVGCSPDMLKQSWGLGLAGMKERARTVKGELELTQPVEGGTCLQVRMPLT